MKKLKKPEIRVHSKRNVVQTRVSNAEMHIFLRKAMQYTKGNLSELLRISVLEFRDKAVK